MAWQPGQSGNPSGGQKRVKPFRNALNMELAAIENDLPLPEVKSGSLRAIARGLLNRAVADTVAAKEVADRLDGKVAQPTGQDDELGPVQHVIAWKSSSTSSIMPQDNNLSHSMNGHSALPVLSAIAGPEKQ